MKLTTAYPTLLLSLQTTYSVAFSSFQGVRYTNHVSRTPSKLHMRMEPSSSMSGTSLKAATLMAPEVEEAVEVKIKVEEPPQPKSFLDDGFVFGLEGSGLVRPKGKVAQVVVEGDTTETQPFQVAIVATTMINHTLVGLVAMFQLLQINNGAIAPTLGLSAFTIFSSWLIADLGSGVLHWSVDNYGNGKTPVMGNLIAAFQGHHSAPWTITERGFCNNVYKLCTPFGIPTVAAISLLAGSSHPMVSLFFTVFCTMEIMSQEFHKWSHMTKATCGPLITKLQNVGVAIGRQTHGLHHVAPYEGNYCIVSGVCNTLLDKSGFFRMLEHIVYKINGVESNSWKLDPKLKAKTLRGEYALNLNDYKS
eukprot:CAMPEP_0198264134 /NCGR_PEP_ID=MMETSP1447-20131203/14905_1 /TAXON_ID=420782 /ORGANISM="Chaetoceros dichaeta, Strain CCMP1751" /LENGTH=362 /DNA_ID=CAMNT_0043952985 /DNA_START=39 /DNA_END=1127 /DNA_ORIENTATION=+